MTVYEALQQRLKIIFDNFDNVYVSFSGGKDSGLLLNLCRDYIKQHNLPNKLGIFHIDYEAQYQMTTDYVDDVYADNDPMFEHFRCCLPLVTPCATSMHQSSWLPWEKAKQALWVRSMPQSINEDNNPLDFFKPGMTDYAFQKRFSLWHHQQHQARRTCVLVGIRTQESLDRWRAIFSSRNVNKFQNHKWTTKMYDNVYNAYPLFDWTTQDVWTANAKFGYTYNHLYDLLYMAGVSVNQMRVASPFNDQAQKSLKFYRVIDPNNWARMIGRVNGVNFTSIYGGTTAMGWNSIKLPKGYTWEKYMYFLLDTLPQEAKDNYLSKLQTSINFWRDKGGVLSDQIIEKLKQKGIEIEVMPTTNYRTDKKPVKMEYLDEINIAQSKEIPTYKRMCICIMKNDFLCKYMGFTLTKQEVQRRQSVINKYQSIL